MLLSKKAIITINQNLGERGVLINESSLDYAINLARKSNNWLKSLAILTRSILFDHVFEEGNKRTTAVVIMTWLEMHNLSYNKDKINSLIVRMLKENIISIDTITEMIKNATI